jgi:hypothetical protein
LTQQRSAAHDADPYMEQLRHLRAVVAGREVPPCSGRHGLRTRHVALAVHEEAARAQHPVSLTF